MSNHLIAFVTKTENHEVAIHHPQTNDDVSVGIAGELRITDYDGDLNVYPASEWKHVKVEDRG